MHASSVIRYRARAAPSAGGLIGLTLIAILGATAVLAALALLGFSRSTAPDWLLWLVFLSSGTAALALGYLVVGYFSIGYDLTETAVRVRWGNRVEEIAVDRLTYAGPAAPLLAKRERTWQLFWPGYYVGWMHTSIGRVRVVATQPPSRQLLLSTRDGHWAISPAQPVIFLEQLATIRQGRADPERRAPSIAGREQLLEAGWTAALPTIDPVALPDRAKKSFPLSREAILADRVALALIGVGLILLLSLVSFLAFRSDSLPQVVTLHWNASGLPDRIGTRRDLWILPFVAAIVFIANMMFAFLTTTLDRFAARLLVAGSVIVLVLTWFALLLVGKIL